MRQVKCRNCSKFIDRDKAISVECGKAKIFYCNEDCRQQAEQKKNAAQKEQAAKDGVYNTICEIFGYKIINSALYKEWAIWNQVAGNDKILAYLEENQEYLTGVIGRLSSGEYPKIRYLSTILKNNLHDYKIIKNAELEKIRVDCEVYEPTVSYKKKRRSLSELEDEVS